MLFDLLQKLTVIFEAHCLFTTLALPMIPLIINRKRPILRHFRNEQLFIERRLRIVVDLLLDGVEMRPLNHDRVQAVSAFPSMLRLLFEHHGSFFGRFAAEAEGAGWRSDGVSVQCDGLHDEVAAEATVDEVEGAVEFEQVDDVRAVEGIAVALLHPDGGCGELYVKSKVAQDEIQQAVEFVTQTAASVFQHFLLQEQLGDRFFVSEQDVEVFELELPGEPLLDLADLLQDGSVQF